MTSPSHIHTQARVQPRNTNNHSYIKFLHGQNITISHSLNPDKTTCTLFTPDPAEYKSNLNLKINNTALPMATHPKVLGLTLDPKLTYSTHIHNISLQAHKALQIIKTLTITAWGNRRRHSLRHKAVRRPALEYTYSTWLLLTSSCALTNCKSFRTQHQGLPQDAHKTQTYTICMRKHSYFPDTSTCSS